MTGANHGTMTGRVGGAGETDRELRIAALRGAPVADVDPARLRAVVAAVCVAAMAVTAVLLFVAGARRNAQVAALHDNGVRVAVTVRGCQGQLGGSGFNFVGYACRGTYVQGHHRYDVVIPGSAFRPAGTKMTLVANPADPRLVATVPAAEHSRPSARVFLVPGLLAAALAGLGVVVGVRHRRSSGRGDAPPQAVATR